MVNPPTQLVIETASICQLRCRQCWTGLGLVDRKNLMPLDLFNRVADEAQDFIKHCYLSNWGEPTLNKHLPEMIHRVKQFATIDLATHGLSLTEEMAAAVAECSTISVSIDGITQDVYEQYRVGGKLDEAMRGLRLLIKTAGHKVNWTFVVFRSNEHQIESAQRLADEIGANIGFKPPLFWDRSKMDSQMPTDDKYRRYVWVDGEWLLKANRLNCREFWQTAYVLPNGDMPVCCYDGQARFIAGNMKDSSLLDVWNGEKYNEMRANHLAGNLNPLCLEHCQLPS